jgi:hypothetical protein
MTKSLKNASETRQSDQARSDLMRRAQAQGVKPFTSLDDYAGEPEVIAEFDVEAFLRQVREDRDRQSNRSL